VSDPIPVTLFDGFAPFVDAQRQAWKAPGCAVAVVKDGGVASLEGFGQRDLARGLPVTPDTLFAIGSCTKAFTCAALGILVDEGRLDWDTPVRDYAPSFRMHDPFASERMTARDLVTHRSGLPRHDALWYAGRFTRREIYDRLRHLEPNKDFRAVWQYNNLMYLAAGVLIEEITGAPWEVFIQERLLGPLGMARTNLSVTASQADRDFARPYHKKSDSNVVEEVPFRNIDAVGPAGAINSSAADMARWLLLNLSKGRHGGARILSEAYLQQAFAPHAAMQAAPDDDPELGQTAYGLGWMISSYRGQAMVQHGGGIDGFLSLTTLLPRQGAGIVVLSNLSSGALNSIVTHRALDLLLGLEPIDWAERTMKREAERKEAGEKGKLSADSSRKPDTRPSHPLEDYAGDYEHPGYGRASVALQDGRLRLSYGSFDLPLAHYHYEVFEGEYEPLEMKLKAAFALDQDGSVASLALPLEPSVKPIVFARRPSQAMTQPGFLARLTGDYEVMGVTAAVSIQGSDSLIVTLPGQPPFELVPAEGARFHVKGLSGFAVEFKLDGDGAAVEAVFHQPNGSYAAKRMR
jgi:CubicO group peptidase (beta-lactamase class C family)